MEKVNKASKKSLKEEEKNEIFRAIGGSKAVQFNFSDSEKRAIIKALNK
jgi:hypothetical protein